MERFILFSGAALLGLFISYLHIPIPFMLGGILMAVVFKTAYNPAVNWPVSWRNLMLGVAGYGIGRNCTMETVRQLSQHTVSVLSASILTISISVLIAVWIYRNTYSNLLTCLLGAMPGGMTQMLLMTEEDSRADANAVTVSQSLRLLCVVASVPFLAITIFDASPAASVAQVGTAWSWGWLWLVPITLTGQRIATWLKVPTSSLLGPIIMAAVISCLWKPLDAVPGIVMAFAQVQIGLYVGVMLDKNRLLQTRHLLPYFLTGTAAMILSSVLIAKLLSGYYHFSVIAAFLAMAPGGIAEMCLAGLSMGEDVSLILTYQLIRVLMLNLLVPVIIKWYFRKHACN